MIPSPPVDSSQLPGSQLPVMTKEEIAKSNDYKTILECAPDDADLARVVFKDIQGDGGATLTRFLATNIASALLKGGSLGESVEVLELAWDRGVQVHPNVYGSVFGICAREGVRLHSACVGQRPRDAKAASDYERMPWEYTSALLAAVHLKKNERVFGMLDEVKANQVTDDKMYELVLGAACQTKQHELVCGILDYMHANGVDSTIGYRNTIRLAFKLGEYDFILELLRLLKEHGIDPTGAYKHQIMALDKAGLHRQVLDAFEALRKEGCICDENTYGAVVT